MTTTNFKRRKERWIATFIAIVVALLTLEVSGYLLMKRRPEIVDRKAYLDYLDRMSKAVISGTYLPHPYRGYIPNNHLDTTCGPGFPQAMCQEGRDSSINSLGFYGPEFSRSPNPRTIRIGVVGGSMANLFVQNSRKIFEDFLKTKLGRSGMNVEVINLAVPAYKQPQQFFTIATLVLAGYRFDAIVNIGGVNEFHQSALNLAQGSAYIFPRNLPWVVSGATASLAAKKAVARLMLDLDTAPTGFLSNSAAVRWFQVSQLAKDEGAVINLASDPSTDGETTRYLLWSSLNRTCEQSACTKEMALAWLNSSISLNNFLTGFGIRYYDFIHVYPSLVDPSEVNQLDREIVKDILSDDRIKAWPLIAKQYRQLRGTGLRFFDLNSPYVFSGIAGQTQLDEAAHLTKFGYDKLADRISNTIAECWESPSHAVPSITDLSPAIRTHRSLAP